MKREMRMRFRFLGFLVVLGVAACGSSDGGGNDTPDNGDGSSVDTGPTIPTGDYTCLYMDVSLTYVPSDLVGVTIRSGHRYDSDATGGTGGTYAFNEDTHVVSFDGGNFDGVNARYVVTSGTSRLIVNGDDVSDPPGENETVTNHVCSR